MKRSILYGLVSSLSFGIMNVLVCRCAQSASSMDVSLIWGGLGCLTLGRWAIPKVSYLFSKDGTILWVRSLAGTGSILCLFSNLKTLPVGDAGALAKLSPIFIVIFSSIFLKERISKTELLAIVAVLLGIILLQSPSASDIPAHALELGIFGSLCAAFAYMSLRHAALRFSTILIVWHVSTVTALVAILFSSNHLLTLPAGELKTLFAAGLMGVIGQIMMTKSFMGLSAAVAAAISLLSVPWAIVLDWLLFGNVPASRSWLAYAIILFALFLLQNPKLGFFAKPRNC